MIQAAFIDMENMVDLLDIKATVVDRPDAKPLSLTAPPSTSAHGNAEMDATDDLPHACAIAFNNVCFA